MTGTVKTVVLNRGFGFITPSDGGDDIFFHCKALSPNLDFDDTLIERRVEYDTIKHNGKHRAVNVRAAS